MYGPGLGWGFGGIGQLLGAVVTVVLGLVGFLIIAGVLVLLIRFLIVGTRAAEVYVAKNRPTPPPPAPVAAPTPLAPTPAPATPSVATPATPPAAAAPPAASAPAAKPPAKPRTPKTPPTA